MCIVAVDYDGTISADFIEARKAMTRLRDAGHIVVVWSSRNNPRQHGLSQPFVYSEMLMNLQKHRIPYDEIDRGDVGKFHAQVYIDDKAIRFEGDWDKVLSKVY